MTQFDGWGDRGPDPWEFWVAIAGLIFVATVIVLTALR